MESETTLLKSKTQDNATTNNAGSTIASTLMPIIGWGTQAVTETGTAIVKEVINEVNLKRLVITIKIINHYNAFNYKIINELKEDYKIFIYKYICCGLWSCMNCCCDKRCLCYFCCCIYSDYDVIQYIGPLISNELRNKQNIDNQLKILNDNSFQIILLRDVNSKWYQKAKQIGTEFIGSEYIRLKIDDIMKAYQISGQIDIERIIVDDLKENS